MSHEDIQRTLQANMPLPPTTATNQSKSHNGHPQPPPQPHHPAHAGHHPVDLNPMDFIEHDVVAPPASAAAAAHASTAPGFDMNLDAFDVFNDFSDLQDNNAAAGHYGGQQQPHLNKIKRGDSEHLAQITEYSPDWAWSDVSERSDCESEAFESDTEEAPTMGRPPFQVALKRILHLKQFPFPPPHYHSVTCCFEKSLSGRNGDLQFPISYTHFILKFAFKEVLLFLLLPLLLSYHVSHYIA